MCPWCDPNADANDTLCRMHEAEYEGLTEDQLNRRDDIQRAEWLDTLS